MLLINDSGERPFWISGLRVGKLAATIEQQGSTRDHIRMFATFAVTL